MISLKAEDGAEFFGRVETVDGQFHARCFARTAQQTEEPEFMKYASEDEALRWIGLRTRERGFPNWCLTPNERAIGRGAERDLGDRHHGPRPNSRRR